MSIVAKVKELYKEKPEELIARIVSYFASSLILPNIIFLLFLTYMSHNNFFSYDFFVEGIFGMKLFFLMTIVFIFTFSLFLSSGIISIICIKEKKCNVKDNIIIFIINFLLYVSIILGAYENIITWGWAIYIILISKMIHREWK